MVWIGSLFLRFWDRVSVQQANNSMLLVMERQVSLCGPIKLPGLSWLW
jgi:hypothetical protein